MRRPKQISIAASVIIILVTSSVLAEESQTLQAGATVRATLWRFSSDTDTTSSLSSPSKVRLDYAEAKKARKAERTSNKIKGKLLTLTETTMTVETSAGEPPLVIPRTDITKLEWSPGKKSRGQGALVGLGIGAGFGAALGAGDGADWAAAGAVVFGTLGTLIGVIVSPGEKWETVPSDKIKLGVSKGPGGEAGVYFRAQF